MLNFSPADLVKQTNFSASKNQTTTTNATAKKINLLFACFNKAKVDESMLKNSTPIIDTATIKINKEKLFFTVNP